MEDYEMIYKVKSTILYHHVFNREYNTHKILNRKKTKILIELKRKTQKNCKNKLIMNNKNKEKEHFGFN